MHDSKVLGRLVSGQFPIAKIEGLADIPSLQFARPSYTVTNAGSITTQRDRAISMTVTDHGPDEVGGVATTEIRRGTREVKETNYFLVGKGKEVS